LVFPLQTGYNVVEVGPAPSQLADFEPFFASGFSYNCRTCHQATAAPPWPPSNVFLFLFLTFFLFFVSFFYCYAQCVEQVEALFDNNNSE